MTRAREHRMATAHDLAGVLLHDAATRPSQDAVAEVGDWLNRFADALIAEMDDRAVRAHQLTPHGDH